MSVVDITPEDMTPEDFSGTSAFERLPNTCGIVFDILQAFETHYLSRLVGCSGKVMDAEMLEYLSETFQENCRIVQGRIVDDVTHPFRRALVLTTREREQARATVAYLKRKAGQ